jgi:hypothetical protein|tara:strand:+ start:34 stop:291 length:258 start_codon:yes stop_codon:yes gene_type:complete
MPKNNKMNIKDFAKRLVARKHQAEFREKPMTSDEVELMSYEKDEYNKRINKKVKMHRAKRQKELWHGSSILNQKSNILNAKNKFR